MTENKNTKQLTGEKAKLAIILVTSLFFVWGLTMNLVNALKTPMENYMQLSGTESALLQVAYYGAYFFISIPAANLARKKGYKAGILLGLALFIAGSFLTVPATISTNYPLFLLAMFVIAAGATSLETNCNPYITKLGDPEKESTRINLAQSFNGVGNIVGPLILGGIVGATVKPGNSGFDEAKLSFLTSTKNIYLIIAIVLIAVFATFIFVKLPTPPGDVEEDENVHEPTKVIIKRLMNKPHFVLGLVAEFIFIGLQVAGMSLFSAYAVGQWEGLTAGQATQYLGILSLLFTVGRFVTTPLMNKFKAGKILGVYMLLSAIFFAAVAMGLGKVSVIGFIISYLFISIGFPTIYSLALHDIQGSQAKVAASMLTMSIVGAALIPLLMSAIADASNLQIALALAVPGFLYCSWYGFKGSVKSN